MVKYLKIPSTQELIVYLFLELLVISNAYAQDDWVDPFDMLNYDIHSKTMIQSDRGTPDPTQHELDLIACEDSLSVCKKTLVETQANISGASDEKVVCTPCTDREASAKEASRESPAKDAEAVARQYMRRFVNILMNAAGMRHSSMEKLSSRQFEVQLSVTDEQLSILRKFAANEGDVSLQALDDVLSDVLKPKSSWISEEFLTWVDYFFSRFSLVQFGYTAIMLVVPLTAVFMVIMGYSVIRIVGRCLILTFVVGFIITYNKMQKVAEIRSYVHQKHHSKMPEQCVLPSPAEMTWSQWWSFGSSRNQEECQKYYEKLWIDPNLHVSAPVVLSEMLTMFFLQPMVLVSDTIVKFSNTILEGLPFGTNWVVLVLSMVMLVFMAVLACGLMSHGQASFLGLHVGFSGRPPLAAPNTQQPSRESSPLTDRHSENVSPATVPAPPVFNININLPRRLSGGKPEGLAEAFNGLALRLAGSGGTPDQHGKAIASSSDAADVQRTDEAGGSSGDAGPSAEGEASRGGDAAPRGSVGLDGRGDTNEKAEVVHCSNQD